MENQKCNMQNRDAIVTSSEVPTSLLSSFTQMKCVHHYRIRHNPKSEAKAITHVCLNPSCIEDSLLCQDCMSYNYNGQSQSHKHYAERHPLDPINEYLENIYSGLKITSEEYEAFKQDPMRIFQFVKPESNVLDEIEKRIAVLKSKVFETLDHKISNLLLNFEKKLGKTNFRSDKIHAFIQFDLSKNNEDKLKCYLNLKKILCEEQNSLKKLTQDYDELKIRETIEQFSEELIISINGKFEMLENKLFLESSNNVNNEQNLKKNEKIPTKIGPGRPQAKKESKKMTKNDPRSKKSPIDESKDTEIKDKDHEMDRANVPLLKPKSLTTSTTTIVTHSEPSPTGSISAFQANHLNQNHNGLTYIMKSKEDIEVKNHSTARIDYLENYKKFIENTNIKEKELLASLFASGFPAPHLLSGNNGKVIDQAEPLEGNLGILGMTNLKPKDLIAKDNNGAAGSEGVSIQTGENKDNEKQAKDPERQAKDSERQAKDSERQAKDSERQAKDSERQAKDSEKQAKDPERQAKDSERQAKDPEKQVKNHNRQANDPKRESKDRERQTNDHERQNIHDLEPTVGKRPKLNTPKVFSIKIPKDRRSCISNADEILIRLNSFFEFHNTNKKEYVSICGIDAIKRGLNDRWVLFLATQNAIDFIRPSDGDSNEMCIHENVVKFEGSALKRMIGVVKEGMSYLITVNDEDSVMLWKIEDKMSIEMMKVDERKFAAGIGAITVLQDRYILLGFENGELHLLDLKNDKLETLDIKILGQADREKYSQATPINNIEFLKGDLEVYQDTGKLRFIITSHPNCLGLYEIEFEDNKADIKSITELNKKRIPNIQNIQCVTTSSKFGRILIISSGFLVLFYDLVTNNLIDKYFSKLNTVSTIKEILVFDMNDKMNLILFNDDDKMIHLILRYTEVNDSDNMILINIQEDDAKSTLKSCKIVWDGYRPKLQLLQDCDIKNDLQLILLTSNSNLECYQISLNSNC